MQWKEYEGYLVSDTGLVLSKRKDYGRRKLVESNIDLKGYENIGIWCDDVRHTAKVHRLVALCYIDNPNNLPQVNHIDGNKLNNNVSNLEWVTNAQNMQHALDNGLAARKTEVRLINLITGVIEDFPTMSSCARAIGAGVSSIQKVCNGTRKPLYGKYKINYK